MRLISKQELKDILDKHDKWLRNKKNGVLADLSSANLSSANLHFANLRSANLIMFQFQREQAYYTFDGALRIGYVSMHVTEWALDYKDVGLKNNYTEEQILMYRQFIEMCLQHFKRNNSK